MNISRISLRSLPLAISLTVKNPEKTLFEGKVVAITSSNQNGSFDILPYHTNFISIIKDFLIIYESDTKITTLQIQGGILKAFENNIHVFLGIKTTE